MIQTETTPNPNSLKFLSEKTLSAVGTEEFKKEKKDEIKIPFVKELLNFKGVELVLLSQNFISVNKTDEVSWNDLKPMIISHLNHYFQNNDEPILSGKKSINALNDNKDETNIYFLSQRKFNTEKRAKLLKKTKILLTIAIIGIGGYILSS